MKEKIPSAEVFLDFEAPEDVLAAILEQAKQEGVEASDAAPSGSASSSLHSPLSGAEITEALKIALLVFKTSAAAIAFVETVRRTLKQFGKRGVARATDRATGKPIVIESQESSQTP